MDASRALAIIDCLDRHGVTVWLDGGWGIDALVGRQTRAHDDLDVLAPLQEVERLGAALRQPGYIRAHGQAPLSFELVDATGHQVDVHPVSFANDGEGRYRLEDGRDWVYPRGSLTGIGHIEGVTVRCLTPEFQMLCHATGYALDATHRADVATLSERYGIPVPDHDVFG
jgi:lincosamide nucleotidyltransferase A/C/D/E